MNIAVLAVVAVVYCCNTFLLKRLTDNWFVHQYLNDLFAMPFMMAYSNLLILATGRSKLQFRSLASIMLLTAFCAFTWECLAPQFNSKSVFDGGDFIAYAFGALLYYLLLARLCSDEILELVARIVHQ